MNVMMGSVLTLWHNAREAASEDPKNAYVPAEEELAEAAKHTDISLLELDVENNTVRISDPLASIDVGALGKGYATEMAAQKAETLGCESYVLNVGGNIRIIARGPTAPAGRPACATRRTLTRITAQSSCSPTPPASPPAFMNGISPWTA